MPKFDAIIIGGGHSGLEKGIEILRSGRSCIAFAKGGSTRSFRDKDYSYRRHCIEFRRLGGILKNADAVVRGEFDKKGRNLLRIFTANEAEPYEAEIFFLATGSFFSGGLTSTRETVFEPIFGLDVDYIRGRRNWVKKDFFAEQPFMSFGVRVSPSGNALKKGREIENLFPTGSIVSRM